MRGLLLLLALALLPAAPAHAENPRVRVTTPMGAFELELCEELSDACAGVAPNTVANFLGYLDRGDYEGSFVHRTLPGFVIQGGSYTFDGTLAQICPGTTCPTIANEFNQPNVRGSVSVPLLSGNPDSGTSGWFVNVSDNSATGGGTNLDAQLFTVFAHVVSGMDVVDAINMAFRLSIGLTQQPAGTPMTPDYECNPDPQDLCQNDYLPYLVMTDLQRVPEPGALASAAAAALALIGIARPRPRR